MVKGRLLWTRVAMRPEETVRPPGLKESPREDRCGGSSLEQGGSAACREQGRRLVWPGRGTGHRGYAEGGDRPVGSLPWGPEGIRVPV